MKKITMTLSIITVFALLLSGCAGGGASNTPATTTAAATQTSAATTGASAAATSAAESVESDRFAEHVNFTANVYVDPTGNDLWDYFADKFNMTIEFIPFESSRRIEAVRIWVATDDLPDIIWIGLNETFYTEWITWMKTGLFAEFPSDLSPWPKIKERHELPVMLGDELMTLDGKLMSLPAMRPNPENNFCADFAFIYRADWAEALGIRKPGDVYTWDEFIDMLQEFIDKDPGGNGPGRTFGVSSGQNEFPYQLGVWQSDPGPWGWEEPAFQVVNGEYVWYPSTDSFLDGLMIAKDLYDRGIIWKDNPVDTGGSMWRDLYYAGQIGAINSRPMSSINQTGRDSMLAINPDLDRELCWCPAYVSSPGKPDEYWQKTSSCFWSCIAMSAKTSEAQMTRFLDYQEWLHTDEGKDICGYFGLEGKDFTRAADGSITLNWQRNADTGALIDPYQPARAFYRQLAMLDGIDPVRNLVTMNPVDVETYAQHQEFYIERIDTIKQVDYIMTYSSLPTKDRLGTFVQEVKAKAIDMLVNASADTFRDEWKAWVATMAPKVQPVLDELNDMPYIPNSPEEMYDYIRDGGLSN